MTAVDLSQTALDIAKTKSNININWIQSDILNLPSTLGQFDLIFDRGCYHNIRYSIASQYVKSLSKLVHPNTKILIISCNSSTPPGITKQHIRDDFSDLDFNIDYLENITGTDKLLKTQRDEWLLLLSII